MSDPRLFVYRQPTPESMARIEAVQDEFAAVPSFERVDNPHLTLLGGNSSFLTTERVLERILMEGPQTAEEQYPMEVTSVLVRQFESDIAKYTIGLFLNPDDGHFSQEHGHYMRMAAKRNKRDVVFTREPHVTIGYIGPEHAFATVTEPAEVLVGESIMFEPLESNGGRIRAKRLAAYRPSSSRIPDDLSVKRVRPGSIPTGFLASLKPQNPAQ